MTRRNPRFPHLVLVLLLCLFGFLLLLTFTAPSSPTHAQVIICTPGATLGPGESCLDPGDTSGGSTSGGSTTGGTSGGSTSSGSTSGGATSGGTTTGGSTTGGTTSSGTTSGGSTTGGTSSGSTSGGGGSTGGGGSGGSTGSSGGSGGGSTAVPPTATATATPPPPTPQGPSPLFAWLLDLVIDYVSNIFEDLDQSWVENPQQPEHAQVAVTNTPMPPNNVVRTAAQNVVRTAQANLETATAVAVENIGATQMAFQTQWWNTQTAVAVENIEATMQAYNTHWWYTQTAQAAVTQTFSANQTQAWATSYAINTSTAAVQQTAVAGVYATQTALAPTPTPTAYSGLYETTVTCANSSNGNSNTPSDIINYDATVTFSLFVQARYENGAYVVTQALLQHAQFQLNGSLLWNDDDTGFWASGSFSNNFDLPSTASFNQIQTNDANLYRVAFSITETFILDLAHSTGGNVGIGSVSLGFSSEPGAGLPITVTVFCETRAEFSSFRRSQ